LNTRITLYTSNYHIRNRNKDDHWVNRKWKIGEYPRIMEDKLKFLTEIHLETSNDIPSKE